MTIVPDTKDWTWVLTRPCAECGFNAAQETFGRMPGRIRECATQLARALDLPDARLRPLPTVWSPLEYAAHVRDVCRIFDYRLSVLLTGSGTPPDVAAFDATVQFVDGVPVFANWDQDETASASNYGAQSPEIVAEQLAYAAREVADSFARVSDLSRSARRSDGAVFTVTTLAQYFLHDLVHHVHDVQG